MIGNKAAFAAAIAVVLAALFVLYRLDQRVGALDERLTEAQRREARLESEAGRLASEEVISRKEAGAKGEEAAEAESVAEEASSQSSAATLEREAAVQRLEEAKSAAEQARTKSASAEEEARRREQELEELRDKRERELSRMQEALSQIAETERTPLGLVVRLGEDALQFDFDDDKIRVENRELLSRIAGVLLGSHGYQLTIYGHTDDQGAETYNQRLSERRAQAVERYLAQAGVSQEIMHAEGLGESSPRAAGASEEARQENRRVEIAVVDTVIRYADDATP